MSEPGVQAKPRITKAPAELNGDPIGVIRNDQLFIGDNGRRMIATGIRPEVIGWSSERTTYSVRRIAKIRGERHFKAGAVNRLWVYLIGEVAICKQCGLHEGYGPPPIITDRAGARRLWRDLD